MQTTEPFAELPIAGFIDIILDGGERADKAMYYLLQHILCQPLRRRYEIFQHQLLDDFDDILDDFFFYLRDGNGEAARTNGEDNTARNEDASGSDNGERPPYPSLRRIRNREAFVQWMLRTFRNYLSVRAAKEAPLASSGLSADSLSVSGSVSHPGNASDIFSSESACGNLSGISSVNSPDTDSTSSILTDEQKLSFASNLIAYAHQKMSPRDGFLLFRALLTMLDKQQALPNEEVAEVLGMTDTSYRVSVHRVKDRLAQYRTRLLKGEPLNLDDPHRQMAQRINEDFLHLYPTLLSYYDQTIAALPPDRADAVNRLRQKHFATTGNLLHEPGTPYTTKLSKAALWNVVGRVFGG